MSFGPDNVFHDGDAPTIDKAIADSVVAHYVSGTPQTLAGHFQMAEPNQFADAPGIKNGASRDYLLKMCQVLPTETIKRSRSN
jgi:hypothetical protein